MSALPSDALQKPPLDGITVIDMSRVLSGPYCTMVLADLGARVIKIERPDIGDDTRQWVPFVGGRSAYFMAFNRAKESIALDLKSPYDREMLDSILAVGDVLVENFRPGVMDRLGYGWGALSSRHPRLVYASISGYGDSGPLTGGPVRNTAASVPKQQLAFDAQQFEIIIPLPVAVRTRQDLIDRCERLADPSAMAAA